MVTKMKPWRESASLIVAAKTVPKFGQSHNYNVLFLKRQSGGSYGDIYVFPGGMIDPSDADLKWQSLFQKYGYNENSFKAIIPVSKLRPEIFCSVENELPREVSLRISAIRETFEECGILICTNKNNVNTRSKIASNFILPKDELEYWQHKVHDNSTEFYNMCNELNCYPNIWGLHELRNWMSANNFRTANKRVDTAFFFTGLSNIPDTKIETKEMQDVSWATPNDMLKKLRTSLFPPQRYEISNFAEYKNFDNLLDHAVEKSRNGAEKLVPVAVGLNDGLVFLLPGDSMYPGDTDMCKDYPIDMHTMSIEGYREKARNTHRIEVFSDPESEMKILSNLQ